MNQDKPTDSNSSATFSFQAEVSKVLDIVIHSLYTDKEIFIRELISNSVDALEKMRHISLVSSEGVGRDRQLEIKIDVDKDANTLTISDTGIGMTRDELITNLGSVAHSGVADFLEKLSENSKKDIKLIGQFGVGFYSVFMVAGKVVVRTRSYIPDASGWEWVSEGSDGFSIQPAESTPLGTSVLLILKEDAKEFAQAGTVKRIIKQYSNFVPFPISVNGERVNTIQAIWTRSKSEITDQEYKDFYKFATGISSSEPLDWLHFSTDAPLGLDALLFIPTDNPERLGFGKIETRVDLHCRKVLIQKQAKDILPQWLRFLTGIVDSQDLPLNISRETMQDSVLIKKINKALTKRFIKHLTDMVENEPSKYEIFWKTFGSFIREGIILDFDNRDTLAALYRFESSKTKPGELTSLDQYLSRMASDQKEVYYIAGANRESIERGPYLEVFRKRDIEVIYNFDPTDDFVMTHLYLYKEKKLVSADAETLDLPEPKESDHPEELDKEGRSVDSHEMGDWIRKILQDKITEVKESRRLVDSPLILVNPDGQWTGAMQRIMQMANEVNPTKRVLEFNPAHPMIIRLNEMRKSDTELAVLALEQLYDHAALNAGITVETRLLVDRMNVLLERTLEIGSNR